MLAQARVIAKQMLANGAPSAIRLTNYKDDASLRCLRPEDGPEATAAEQAELTESFANELRKLVPGVEIMITILDHVDYQIWLAAEGLPNNAANRAKFISKP